MASAVPCVHFDRIPTHWAQQRWDYYSEQRFPSSSTARRQESARWQSAVHSARNEIRASHDFAWRIMGAELMSARDWRARFAGVIFVGDSQVREVAWAALRFLADGRTLHYNMRQGIKFLPLCHNKSSALVELGGGEGAYGGIQERYKLIYDLNTACSPRGIGRYGFTASCTTLACTVHSPLDVRTQEEICAQVSLF
mmetsp:Transcript_69294/g.154570  ORF Transcript_69294/g.154570 Transcript_69294/m.154570 type:complete len:197 (+) Transcript_69294:50-640(+)